MSLRGSISSALRRANALLLHFRSAQTVSVSYLGFMHSFRRTQRVTNSANCSTKKCRTRCRLRKHSKVWGSEPVPCVLLSYRQPCVVVEVGRSNFICLAKSRRGPVVWDDLEMFFGRNHRIPDWVLFNADLIIERSFWIGSDDWPLWCYRLR